MKPFRLQADITFLAEGIDDAFAKLAEHFRQLSEEEDLERPSLFTSGEISVEPSPPGLLSDLLINTYKVALRRAIEDPTGAGIQKAHAALVSNPEALAAHRKEDSDCWLCIRSDE